MDAPTLDAYLKAMGFDEQKNLATSQAEQQRGQVQAQYDLGVPDLMRQTQAAQQNVAGDALGRGIYNSGERMQNLSNVNTAAQASLGHMQLSRDQGVQDINMNLARQQAGYDIGQRQATWNWQQYMDQRNEAARQAMLAAAGQQSGLDAANNANNAMADYYRGILAQMQMAGQAGGVGAPDLPSYTNPYLPSGAYQNR